jgi:hypothetical protein
MNTTEARAAFHKRIDPVLEAMIIRELTRQVAAPQPEAQLAALAPTLLALLASQQRQQVPIQWPRSPLATLLPVLTALLTSQRQRVPVQQPRSPLATLLPALAALLAGQQQQPTQLSPLVSALSAALAPVFASVLIGRPRGKTGDGKQDEENRAEPEEGRDSPSIGQ